MLSVLTLLFAQAALPPPGLHYYAREDYTGPGLVCGAVFSMRLRDGETAALIKSSFIDAEMTFHTREGQFTVHESQYATDGGKLIRKVGDGVLRRKRDKANYTWVYRDSAPGSTDVSGPAVNARKPSPALNRVMFGSPRNGFVGAEKCIDGIGSDQRSS
jgi:hypothetical protein